MTHRILAVALLLHATALNAQNGLWLDGIDDHAIASAPGPTGNAARTVEAWMYQDQVITTQQVILTWGEMPLGERFTLNIINGLPRIEVGGSGFSSTTLLPAGAWHHLAATYDPNASPSLRLYVDGILKASGTPSVTVNTSIYGGIQIGRRQDSINHFMGRIDEVRVWSVVRTPAQLVQFKDVEFCDVQPGLVAYYRLDQGVAGGNNAGIDQALDEGSNGSDAQLIDLALTGPSSNWNLGAPVVGDGASSQSIIPCGPWTSPSGNVYFATGTYTDTVTTSTGCTNVLTTDLTVEALDTLVGQLGTTLIAQGIGYTYQWLDCGNGYTAIPGATGTQFMVTQNGSYAVQVSEPGCSDTSGCHTISTVGITERTWAMATVHPNPATDRITLSWAGEPQARFEILDIEGRVHLEGTLLRQDGELDLAFLPPGTYIVVLRTGALIERLRFIKQ